MDTNSSSPYPKSRFLRNCRSRTCHRDCRECRNSNHRRPSSCLTCGNSCALSLASFYSAIHPANHLNQIKNQRVPSFNDYWLIMYSKYSGFPVQAHEVGLFVGLGEGDEVGYEITYQRYATDYFTCLRSVRTACSPSSSTTH